MTEPPPGPPGVPERLDRPEPERLDRPDPLGQPTPPDPPRPDVGEPWPLATWPLQDTIAVAFFPFGVALVATIAVFSFGGRADGWTVALTLVQQLALGAGIAWWVRATTGSTAALGLRDVHARDLGAGVAAGFGALVASSIVITLTQQLTGAGPVADPLRSSGDAWVIPNALMALLLAPVCEEIAFRGFLFGGLRRRLRFRWAAAASAALFALIHGDPVRIPGLFVSGLILATVYERRRTLGASIATHAVVNAVAIIALVGGAGR